MSKAKMSKPEIEPSEAALELRRSVSAAVRDAALVINAGARPWYCEIAAHHGVSRATLSRELKALGLVALSTTGPFTHPQAARHVELLPHISLVQAIKDRVKVPPYDELLDAHARWGVEGMCEEYEVDDKTIARWLKQARKGLK